ncbi:MAG: hypothetical protein BroJett026_06800 [Betaproteobacteria bacterium]|nr:MAG: hypothetical protein BroJett026_06800 [Betaproteobacteria bacterium]
MQAGAAAPVARSRANAERAMALLRPTIEAIIADPAISPGGALAIAVADSSRPDVPFDDALLGCFTFGRTHAGAIDYERHALDKARASHRGRADTSVVREHAAALLVEGLPFAGGVHRRGWSIGVSGAEPRYEEAIGAIAGELLHALAAPHGLDSPRGE